MPDRLKDFQQVLTEAVNDMAEHGFDSVERVERWTRELRAAAERSLISEASLEQQLRDALASTYRRLIDRGEITRYQQGVERFTLEKVRPVLRAELDRRIAASANLIKLNRTEAIEKTLRRFQGWSTSVPPGGVPGEKKRDVKDNVRKSMASLPFEERRVLIDQGHKLIGAINEIVAADGGAIAGVWRSHWRRAGYDYREDHKERDGLIFLIRDSWADQAGYVKRGPKNTGPADRKAAGFYYDDVEAVGQLPFCSCFMTFLYNLRDLPDDMVTARGREALAIAREQIARTDTARADSVPAGLDRVDVVEEGLSAHDHAMLVEAGRLDRLGYLAGLTRIEMVPDRDEWNAEQITDGDKIRLQAKISRKPPADQVHIILHEAGHRGQDVDPETWEAFKRRHVASIPSFVAIANPVHLKDFARTKMVDGLAAEVFAESYARACLGLPMSPDLAEFWQERFAGPPDRSGLLTQTEAAYTPAWPNKITRCQRCEAFIRLRAGTMGNACLVVEGEISAGGHCGKFFISGARADSLEEVVVPKVGAAAEIVRLERLRAGLEAMKA